MDNFEPTAAARPTDPANERMPTDIVGLDDVLGGGFPANRLYLLEGDPGTGKTTFALQFLLAGARRGEPVLYVTLSETEDELRANAGSHGWTLAGVNIFELIPPEESLRPEAQYTIFHPSEIELSDTTGAVLAEVERLQPRRIVFDSLSEMRLLAGDALRYRRQLIALKQYFAGRRCTVLLLDDRTTTEGDLQVHSIAHGVISLEQIMQPYGAERRCLRVRKLRGSRYRGGNHDFKIETGGNVVFPRLVAAEHHEEFARMPVPSGVGELDALLGGGLDRGTSTLLLGPAGSGKSSVAARFAATAAERGEISAIYVFDETLATYIARARGLGIDLQAYIDTGRVRLQQIDPAELTPGEFTHILCRAVDQEGARVVVIDSLNGYLQAMPEERYLIAQMHELLMYLNQKGVVSLLVTAQHGFLGSSMIAPVDVSYLADTVLLFRYFEARGAVRNAISVVKKRTGYHERAIRELNISKDGVVVGRPLTEFHGVLTGVPLFSGSASTLREATSPREADATGDDQG
ncbi:MAG TPA: ATPase domain-containing protein [Pyrinomonadaceae bacterium]|jgi:circadian clock protein KaiC